MRGRAERSYFLYCPPKTREDTANTRAVYSGAGTRGEKILSLLSTKNKRAEDNSEYTLRVFGCGDARREATFFTVHQKQEKMQRIHAPCIRVWGRAERSYFLYCPPKTRDDAANTHSVYSGAGTRGEKLLSLLSTKNKRRCSEYTLRVFGCGDARREAAFFTVHQKQEISHTANTRSVYSGAGTRGDSSYFLYCPPKTREDAANTRSVYSGAGTRGEKLLSLLSTKNKRRYSEYTRRVFGCGARAERSYFLYCPPKTRDDAANTCAVYSGAGTRGEKLLSLLSTKNKRRYSEYTRRVFGCGDARREATFFTVHQKQEILTQRIHAPCIRVRGRAERSYFLYCPPKNKRRYGEYTLSLCIRVRGRAERSYFLYCPPKTREDEANTRSVYSGAGTRGEKLLSLLSTKNKRRYLAIHAPCIINNLLKGRAERSYFLYCLPIIALREDTGEYTLRVFGCGDARREATFFTVHQKQEKIQRIHAPCIRVRGRAERSYFLYCPPKTREDMANTRSVYSWVRGRAERSYFLYCPPKTREDTANTRAVYSGSGTRE